MSSSPSSWGMCDNLHISKPSEVWCSDCEECLCTECLEQHSLAKPCRNHTTIPIHDHITPTLETLHWLPIHYRVQYKVLLYVFKALKQEAPLYLEELVNIYKPARSLRSESNTTLVTPIVRIKSYGERRFDKAAPLCGTIWRTNFEMYSQWTFSKRNKRLIFFRQAFLSF